MIIDSPIISGSYLSTGSLSQTGNVSITGSLTVTGGISGSFSGSGADLFGIPASGITGLNLSQIASGSASASVSPNNGFVVNTNTKISGSTQITGSLGVTGSFSVSGSTGTVFSSNADSLLITGSLVVTGSTIITGSLSVSGSITGSLEGTASYSLFALTSSYSLGGSGFPFSGSAVITGSLLVSGSAEITGSLSVSGSISASLFGTASQATSASYALTASYLLGYISPFPFTGSAAITGSLIVTGSVAISTLTTGSGVRYVIADQNGLLSAQTASAAIFTTQQVVSTAGQTTFPITNGYSTGYVTVFVNGTKLSADEYVDTSGTNIIFLTGSTAGDNVEFQKYLPAAGVSNNTLRSTNYFTATTGQTNFSVNYTPGLIDIFYNGAKLDNTEYTAANGTSITLATASAAGDRLEVDVYSYQVGAFSGIGGTGAANQLAYFNTSNSITGSNAFTVSGSAIIITGSLIVSGSGTLINIGPTVFSGSVTSTAGFSGSFSGNADSASLAQNSLLLQGTGSVGFATTASLLAVSSSQQQISASLLNVVANYATTGSNSFRANQSITGSLVVSSTITAQTLVVQTVTSSIVYSSGSNIFGSQLSDKQTFTGSLQVTGSGTHTIFGNVAIGTTSTFGKLSILDTDNTTISSALWGSSTGAGVVASVYNASQTTNSVAGIRLVTRDSGASIWNMYNISTGASTGDLAFGNGSGGAGTEKMRITNSGLVGIGITSPGVSLDISGSGIRITNPTAPIFYFNNAVVQWKAYIISNTTHHFAINDAVRDVLTLGYNGSPSFFQGGNVGIGVTNPGNKLAILAADETTNPTLGTNAGKFGIFNGTGAGTYGMIMGVINNGNTYLQVQRIDGTATAYNLLLQPSGGNVGIGIPTANPYVKLDIRGGGIGQTTTDFVASSAGSIIYMRTGATTGNTTYGVIQVGNTGDTTGGSLVLNQFGGNVAIGNTSPGSKLVVNNAIAGAILPYINGTGLSYNSDGISVAGSNTNNTNIGNGLTLYNNVASVGAYSPVIAFSSMTPGGAYNATYAFITGIYQGAGGDSNWSVGDLMFGTGNQYGAQERMRITSAGDLFIANTTNQVAASSGPGGWSYSASSYQAIATNSGVSLYLNRINDDGAILVFRKNGTNVGSISTNSNSLPSDLNFKKNINNLDLGLNLVTKLRAVSYNHKIDDDDTALSTGFIAQELEQSLTELGIEENKYHILQHTPNEDETQSQYWLDYTKIIPVLTKAIQEQNVLIQELQEKLQRNNIN